jgi:hypothetical protein
MTATIVGTTKRTLVLGLIALSGCGSGGSGGGGGTGGSGGGGALALCRRPR